MKAVEFALGNIRAALNPKCEAAPLTRLAPP